MPEIEQQQPPQPQPQLPVAADSGENSNSNSSENVLFGKYEVGRLLGCGAFAKVYHARNIETGQSVAIKCISKQKIMKGGLMAHIKREISIMRRLQHPNIVKLYEVLATKSKIYCVMEFVKGGELFTKIAKARFGEDLSRRYFQQLISALGYCHAHGVFHRDLKPENLLVDENGDLKVSDFGLSAVASQIRNDGMLHTLCGTPAYVAPEILMKKGYDGAKVDIWSCGVILFVLNAGYLPFNDPNLMVMYRKIYKGEYRIPKWTSPELKHLISRLLDTNPNTRITIDEILKDPWFKKGYKQIEFHQFDSSKPDKKENRNLNAFDLISFSSGVDLSGLFNDSGSSTSADQFRIISTMLPEDVIKKVKDFGKKNEISVRTREWTAEVVGQNGQLKIVVEVYRLMDTLVVVEIRSYDKNLKEKLCAELPSLDSQPAQAVAGN